MLVRSCVFMQHLFIRSPFKFRHCYSASCFHLYADLWLPGDRCVWNKHLPGSTKVAPWQRVSGSGSKQRVHASTHRISWRNGGAAWACVSSFRQWERLKKSHTTGSWPRWTLLCLQGSILSWVEGPTQDHYKLSPVIATLELHFLHFIHQPSWLTWFQLCIITIFFRKLCFTVKEDRKVSFYTVCSHHYLFSLCS